MNMTTQMFGFTKDICQALFGKVREITVMVKEDCIFCKIANKQIPTEFLYESENVVVFNDLHPKAKTHLLVIPKSHHDSLNELEDVSLIAEIFDAIKKVTEKLGIKHFKVHLNTGKEAGQVVFHIHFHILAN